MERSWVYIRFNTRNDNDNPLPWRVLTERGRVDGVLELDQQFAAEVRFTATAVTSCDEVEAGVLKWHLKAHGYLAWDGDVCTVCDQPAAP
ncbi:hypothetical protein [Massilia pseudoviolaceinigra]|uniref:hypothetical protein n=1 Tax=Massilia pseudoviolaceinigra TaxID=3057165 RepID=UPI0027964E71|nr:hypothetical protein [Massilia sp. CCM 9206]MDQ1923120.1 hypothetical protein [Massilia sp. CCM 9206]